MAAKPPPGHDSPNAAKKQKKGFNIGPANLPDGLHRRKVQKIKKDLIHKAKLKKQYAKLKSREEEQSRTSVYEREGLLSRHDNDDPAEPVPAPSLEPHPDRLKMLEAEERDPGVASAHTAERRKRHHRPQPFQKETEMARKGQEEAQARQKARQEAEKERTQRLAERDRFRKAMAKARGGPNGQRKLGRESTVLLAKAQRLMGKT